MNHIARRSTGVVHLFAIATTALCSNGCSGGVGDGVRPKDFTGTGALGRTASCGGEPKFAKPLVVDLDPSERTDLEAAMKNGVVVVGYDCKTLRVLPSCRLADGGYQYAGVSRKEQVVQLKTQDELSANLPFGSAKLGAEMQSGRSIDLALVLVGLRSTTIEKVDRSDLSGSCEGATHFMQTASVGAFSMATGSVGKVAAVAQLFAASASASSESSRKAATSDGSLEDCRTSNPDADAPPRQCRAPISVQLLPIQSGAPAATRAKSDEKKADKAILNPCPSGYAYAGGICTQTPDVAHVCDRSDRKDCKEQCEKGSAESCFNYASGPLLTQDPGFVFDPKDALPYFKKACDGQIAEGCGDYGYWLWELTKDRDGLRYARMGCDMGGGWACWNLGTLLFDENGPGMDTRGGMRAFERGCALGEHSSCLDVAIKLRSGADGVKKDPRRAIDVAERSCQADYTPGCLFVAEGLADPDEDGPVKKDPERAMRALRRVCKSRGILCPSAVSAAVRLGKAEEAFGWARAMCEVDEVTCYSVAELYEAGKGTKKDPGKAKEAWRKSCQEGAGIASSCEKIGFKKK